MSIETELQEVRRQAAKLHKARAQSRPESAGSEIDRKLRLVEDLADRVEVLEGQLRDATRARPGLWAKTKAALVKPRKLWGA